MVGIRLLILFLVPVLLLLAYRRLTRGSVRDPLGLESSPRLQRMEQTIDSIAIEVERLVEAQRFTTKVLAERQLDPTPRVQAAPREEPDTITPH